MCEHAKIYGKCDVCLRAEIETLVGTMEEANRQLEEARLAVARMLPWKTLSDAQEYTIEVLAKERDDYKSQLDELVNATILGPLKGKTAHDEIVTLRAERLELRRSLFELIELCSLDSVGAVDDDRVRKAKELIRCSVQGCGLGGACDGKGLAQYPCPLRQP